MAQRESILPPLSNSIYIKIRQDFLELSGGDHCMAALLSYYEYKLNAIISNMEEMKLKNKSYIPSADDYFIECSPSFLSKALLGLFGRTKIIEANDRLHEQNFITIKTERIGNQYKTTRVALNIEPIKKSLLTLFENGQPLIQKQTTPYSNLNNPLFENEQPPYSETDRINSDTNKENKEEIKEQMDYTSFLLFWNTSFVNTKIKKVITITDKRKKAINSILKVFSKDDIRLAVEKIRKSKFANGENDRGWVITFDWLFIISNFTKVLEGNYDNNKADTSKSIYG